MEDRHRLNGFQSGSRKYKKNYPIWEVLDFASRHGFEGVELVGDWPSGGYPSAKETERVRALRRLYDSFGCASSRSNLVPMARSIRARRGERRGWSGSATTRSSPRRWVADCVGMWPGGGLRGQTIDQAIAALAQTFREAGKIAGDLGLLACFEIEPVFAFNKADHYERILHGADHPALKGIYDPSHFDQMNGAVGKPEELLLRVGVKNIGYVQFCDTDSTLRDGGTSKHLGCGDGRVDCAKSLRSSRKVASAGG